MTLRDARTAYFAANGFPADGGYSATWVPLTFGPLTLYLYNSAARKRAIPIHDLHHIVTGYGTTPVGEAEVAAWELGAGCAPHHVATVINLYALFYGALLWPRRMWAAYALGRRAHSLYQQPLTDADLDASVEAARARVVHRRPGRSARIGGFLLQVGLGAVLWSISLAILVLPLFALLA